jgi:DegV family protein with EDD domain
VVSVHLSGELSGTVGAAELAARESPVPVRVVDSRTVAMGLGFAVLAAAEAARDAAAAGTPAAGTGRAGAEVAERARSVAASSHVLFVVEGLDHLRRGGRIGGTAAAVGGLLGMRPLLTVRDGRVQVAGTVRTRRAARERLVETVAADVARRPGARVAVHHLARPDLGEEVAAAVRERLTPAASAAAAPGSAEPAGAAGGPLAPEVLVADVSAVVGAHAGPGLLGVVVADA